MTSPEAPAQQLYCPFCASLFETTGREWRCPVGDMGLSQKMKSDLVAAFLHPGIDAPPRPFQRTFGGTWFCPRDRSRMEENDGILACPTCHRSLNRYVYALLELHPHARVP